MKRLAFFLLAALATGTTLGASSVTNNAGISQIGPPFSITNPTNGQALIWSPTAGAGGAWINGSGGGSGTVTSVGITSTSNTLSVTGTSPITGSGTLDLEVLAVPASALPAPTASSLGGVESLAAVSHNFLTSISTLGVPTQAQPAAGDISGLGTAATVNTGTSGATIPLLNAANTWGAVQTYTNSDFCLLGSSTGCTTLTSANAGASNYTATLPANTGTVAELNLAQTWAALQQFTKADLALLGSSTGYTLLESGLSSTSNNTLTLPSTASDTLAGIGTAQTWAALQKFTNADFAILGSSTGYTLLESGLSSTSNNTLTLPSTASDTLAGIGTAQTWSAAQTFPTSDILIKGSSTGTTALASANASSTSYTDTFPAATGNVITSAAISTGLAVSGTSPYTLTSNAESFLNFVYSAACCVAVIYDYHTFPKAATVDNVEVSTGNATGCSPNPTVLVLECGTSTTCSSPTTISTVSVSGSTGARTSETVSSSAITSGDSVAFETSAGSCTASIFNVTVAYHMN